MMQLHQWRERLADLEVQVLTISFGTRAGGRRWLTETKVNFPLLLDPDRLVYRAYELERSLSRSWNLNTIWRYVKLLAAGRKWRGVQGDSAQLGADFVVDSTGVIRLAHYSADPTDRPSVDQLFSAIPIEGEHS